MVNIEHKLTVDDLIVEYMVYKVKNGYDPSFTTSEFITFLTFFETRMKVEDALYENEKLFKRFFERKEEHDWSSIINYVTMEKKSSPHMDMVWSEDKKDYIIKANYKLSNYDISVINTYFMDRGINKFTFGNREGVVSNIRNIIGQFLADVPKRKLNENIEVNDNESLIGKYTTAQIIQSIWENYIEILIERHQWPIQCKDMNKYFLETDLAQLIGLESIKKDLQEFYTAISRRMAIMYHQEKHLKISICSGSYLKLANYELLSKGYEKFFRSTFGAYKKSLNIELLNASCIETSAMNKYDGDGTVLNRDPDLVSDSFDDSTTLRLVRHFDKFNGQI